MMKKLNFDGRVFCSINNTENGEADSDTLFYYHQEENNVFADYDGGKILKGHLIGKFLENGDLDILYHHLNKNGEIKIGKCLSTPELMENGFIKIKEQWQWLSGEMSSGYSELVEIDEL